MGREGRRRTVSVLLTTSEGAAPFQRTLSISKVRWMIGGFGFLCLLGLLSIVLLLREVRLRAEIREIRTRSEELELQLRQLDHLEQEIARMERLGDQVRAMAGVSRDTLAEDVGAEGVSPLRSDTTLDGAQDAPRVAGGN